MITHGGSMAFCIQTSHLQSFCLWRTIGSWSHNTLHNDTQSSSRGKSPSALHSYSKRRFIRPFAPPCSLFTFFLVVGSWLKPGGQWEGGKLGARRKLAGESRPERTEGRWLKKFFNNSIVWGKLGARRELAGWRKPAGAD